MEGVHELKSACHPIPKGKEPTPHARLKDTFLTTLYVMVDDFCHSQPPKRRPGPQASLSESEVITLAIFARWGRFCGERGDFYRYARRCLHDAFPTLPDRSQFNRLVRSCVGLIEEGRACFLSHGGSQKACWGCSTNSLFIEVPRRVFLRSSPEESMLSPRESLASAKW